MIQAKQDLIDALGAAMAEVAPGSTLAPAFESPKQATHGDLARRLAELEDKTEALAMQHDTFSRNTRAQLKQVFDALRELATPPDPPKRPIGFVTPEDNGRTAAGAKGKA